MGFASWQRYCMASSSGRQTLRRWTESTIYVMQGDHHVGHWPTFLVLCMLLWRDSVLLPHSYKIPWRRGSFLGVFFPVEMRSLQRDDSISNDVMQQKGSFRHCGVGCKRDHSILAGKGVMGVHSTGEVWSTIALFSTVIYVGYRRHRIGT